NMQRMNQEYLAVVQIVDENNVAYYIDWEKGSAASAQDSSVSIKWKPTVNGSYRVIIFVLTDLENPVLLSKNAVADIVI
ncbi:MAG: hypothetical protein ACREBU_23265, partial [Nitrososphaera sp.]